MKNDHTVNNCSCWHLENIVVLLGDDQVLKSCSCMWIVLSQGYTSLSVTGVILAFDLKAFVVLGKAQAAIVHTNLLSCTLVMLKSYLIR